MSSICGCRHRSTLSVQEGEKDSINDQYFSSQTRNKVKLFSITCFVMIVLGSLIIGGGVLIGKSELDKCAHYCGHDNTGTVGNFRLCENDCDKWKATHNVSFQVLNGKSSKKKVL